MSVRIKTPLMSSSRRNVLVLSQFRVGICQTLCVTQYCQPPPCWPPPPLFPKNPSQILTRNPFCINQWRRQNQGTPLQQDLLRARLLLFFLLFSPFSPVFSTLLHLVYGNFSGFLLFSLALSLSIVPQQHVSSLRYFLDFLTVSLLIPVSPFLTLLPLHGPTLLLYFPLHCNFAT